MDKPDTKCRYKRLVITDGVLRYVDRCQLRKGHERYCWAKAYYPGMNYWIPPDAYADLEADEYGNPAVLRYYHL